MQELKLSTLLTVLGIDAKSFLSLIATGLPNTSSRYGVDAVDCAKLLHYEYESGDETNITVNLKEWDKQNNTTVFTDTPETLDLTITEVDQNGGEGQGDNYDVTFKIKSTTDDPADTVHVTVTLNYSSYEGIIWDYPYFSYTAPTEVTVIRYQTVNTLPR